jgi:hypothetical protein
VNLNLIRKESASPILFLHTDERMNHGQVEKIPSFSRYFLEYLCKSLQDGALSVRRAAALLFLEIDDLVSTIEAHGIDFKIDI